MGETRARPCFESGASALAALPLLSDPALLIQTTTWASLSVCTCAHDCPKVTRSGPPLPAAMLACKQVKLETPAGTSTQERSPRRVTETSETTLRFLGQPVWPQASGRRWTAFVQEVVTTKFGEISESRRS